MDSVLRDRSILSSEDIVNDTVRLALCAYREATNAIKRATIAFVESIEEVPVTRIGTSDCYCFSVSLHEVMNNGFILSPFYYDVRRQKEELIAMIQKSKNLEFLKHFEEIANSGKRIIRSGNVSHYQYYAPSVVQAIQHFISEEKDYV